MCTHKNRLYEAILMKTQHTFTVKKNRKVIPIMPPDLALCLTLISSNYPCLEHIFMVPSSQGVRAIEVRLYLNERQHNAETNKS